MKILSKKQKKKTPSTEIYERPSDDIGHSKSIAVQVREEIIKFTENGGIVIMDNRTIHNNVSGLTGQQNLVFGDHGTINQNNNQLSSADIDNLLQDLKKFALENSHEQDLKIVDSIEENVKSGKTDVAKTLFEVLSKVVTTSAAGVNIAKAFGWI